tara:strand:- start:641 stop:1267 length:627 start_codon:yes stop_codon:yes gene_type:complete
MKRVLVACERFGVVRDAFIAAGFDAWSCDLHPDDRGSVYHVQQDVKRFIETKFYGQEDWDLIIMHPPCTALAVSGNAHYSYGKPKWNERLEAVEWTKKLWEAACEASDKVCMENPVGILPRMAGIKCTQYIQPWEFGHPDSKKTGLWLHGLPKLKPTNVLDLPECGYWENQTPSGQNKLGPSDDRAMKRARTYKGVADAMVKQWGAIL